MEKRIPVPIALNGLITYVNQETEQLRNTVANASIEQLKILGLSIEDGWRLDYDRREFVKLEQEEEQQSSE